jgi:hypothetical protein
MRGEAGVPHQLPFFLRARLENFFTIGAAVVGQLADGFSLRRRKRRYQDNKRNRQDNAWHRTPRH